MLNKKFFVAPALLLILWPAFLYLLPLHNSGVELLSVFSLTVIGVAIFRSISFALIAYVLTLTVVKKTPWWMSIVWLLLSFIICAILFGLSSKLQLEFPASIISINSEFNIGANALALATSLETFVFNYMFSCFCAIIAIGAYCIKSSLKNAKYYVVIWSIASLIFLCFALSSFQFALNGLK
jgi:hypothetical protein